MASKKLLFRGRRGAGGSLGRELERVSVENELVIATWSPIHLRAKLKEFYWKEDKPDVAASTFWEDSSRYLYLPRLKNHEVLTQAISAGAATQDFFGTAYGQSSEKYDGFLFGNGAIQIDDTLLLIEPAAAKVYQEAQAAARAVTQTNQPPQTSAQPTSTNPTSSTGSTSSATVPPTSRAPKSFHASGLPGILYQ